MICVASPMACGHVSRDGHVCARRKGHKAEHTCLDTVSWASDLRRELGELAYLAFWAGKYLDEVDSLTTAKTARLALDEPSCQWYIVADAIIERLGLNGSA